MKKYILDKWKSSLKLFFGKIAKNKLLWKKREDVAIFEIMEAYLTDKVLAGEENRRQELAEMQKKIEEFNLFIKFLEKI